jgi:hypothetical protein
VCVFLARVQARIVEVGGALGKTEEAGCSKTGEFPINDERKNIKARIQFCSLPSFTKALLSSPIKQLQVRGFIFSIVKNKDR